MGDKGPHSMRSIVLCVKATKVYIGNEPGKGKVISPSQEAVGRLSLDSTPSSVCLTCIREAHSTNQLKIHFPKGDDTSEMEKNFKTQS